jgi:hypothetical protein
VAQRAPAAVRLHDAEAANTWNGEPEKVTTAFSGGARGGSSVQVMKPNESMSVMAEEEPILLLNGFGVGSFHQHRLIPYLLCNDSESNQRSVYCMDYLGQG